jgi:predicted AAA+ superfamily ATPase
LVGSPLSINALREDLQVNFATVARWLAVLERMYAVFRVAPFGAARIRAVKKEQKHYHFDWTLVKKAGPRLENCLACHLLKWVHFLQDSEGRDVELRYFRDVDRREVDFVVVEDNLPILCVECKWGETTVAPALCYFKRKFPQCRALQITADDTDGYRSPEGIDVMPAYAFLRELA